MISNPPFPKLSWSAGQSGQKEEPRPLTTDFPSPHPPALQNQQNMPSKSIPLGQGSPIPYIWSVNCFPRALEGSLTL